MLCHSWTPDTQAGELRGVEHNGEHFLEKVADLKVSLLSW